jgi:hypothetical protein
VIDKERRMRRRWLVALGVAVLGVGSATAQPAPFGAPAREVPCDLPPLLPVPQTSPPLAEVPRPGPVGGEYDHGYNYLPEQLPPRSRRPDDVCGPPGRWWVTPSLELAFASTRPAPATVTLGAGNPAALSMLAPSVLLPVAGQTSGRFEAALGLVAGRWFGETNTHGVEASFFLRDANTTFLGNSIGAVVVFPRGTRRGAQVIALPGELPSMATSTFPVTLGTLYTTADVSYRRKLLCTNRSRLDGLAGYRYAYLRDELYLGDEPDDHDEYRQNRTAVSNSFHGGQIGLAGEIRANGWYVAGSAKVAFGVVTAEAEATGTFVGAGVSGGAAFHRLSALGSADRNEFAVMPALNVQLGRQVTDHARVFAGYTFNYLSRAARLGDALNPATAGLTFTEFWVQSVSFGAEFRF